MEWIYKIRRAVPERYIKYAIYIVLIAIFFNLVVIATAQAQGFEDFESGHQPFYEELHGTDEPESIGSPMPHESPDYIPNSEALMANSPDLMENDEDHPDNSRYSHSDHIIRGKDGSAIMYYKETADGVVNFYGYDGVGRIGFIPAPHK